MRFCPCTEFITITITITIYLVPGIRYPYFLGTGSSFLGRLPVPTMPPPAHAGSHPTAVRHESDRDASLLDPGRLCALMDSAGCVYVPRTQWPADWEQMVASAAEAFDSAVFVTCCISSRLASSVQHGRRAYCNEGHIVDDPHSGSSLLEFWRIANACMQHVPSRYCCHYGCNFIMCTLIHVYVRARAHVHSRMHSCVISIHICRRKAEAS